jgi:predicted DNA-binding transcriptional regulator AlpA
VQHITCTTFGRKRTVQKMQQYLTLTELRAKLGGRSRSAIYTDLEAGRLPQPVKLGGRLYWPEGDVDAHLREMRDKAA